MRKKIKTKEIKQTIDGPTDRSIDPIKTERKYLVQALFTGFDVEYVVVENDKKVDMF